MKISIVVPAYNEEKFIKKCLKSLINQDLPADEIIVIDNNCTDKTAKIAKEFGVKVVTEKKQGLTHARNKGFNISKYEIIARCDADTIVPKDWTKKIVDNFKKKRIDALSGPIIYYDSFLKSASSLPAHIYLESLRFVSNGSRYLVGPNMAIRRKIWLKVKDKINLNDKAVHEDIDLSINITRVGGKIGYDRSMVIKSSSRRIIHKPNSFFVEYPTKMVKTFLINKLNS